MILVWTGSDDATADYLCQKLDQHRVSFVRFNTDAELSGIECHFDHHGPTLKLNGDLLRPSEFSHVWFRRPKPLRVVADASPAELQHIATEWSETIEGFLAHISLSRWINHPSCNANASHKLEQLTRARHLGFCTPDTLVTQNADDLRDFWRKCDGQVIVKPIASGFIERSEPDVASLIYTSRLQDADLADLSELPNCPTLFQRRIEKVDDIRLTVIDEDMVAVSLKALDNGEQRIDIRRDNMTDVDYTRVAVPDLIRDRVLKLMRAYGLRFAAIDFVIDQRDRWWFLEVNPNGQWAWLDLMGVSDISSLFIQTFRRRDERAH